MNQPVFPYARMRTRKVGGGNAHLPRAHARVRKNRQVHETTNEHGLIDGCSFDVITSLPSNYCRGKYSHAAMIIT